LLGSVTLDFLVVALGRDTPVPFAFLLKLKSLFTVSGFG